ncbi:glycosyltransferase [Exiguobacterium sp. s28]|uniref:glycosyltransferase family 2 protein n=1 Tax=Exiguobacterium sp. s28 TaxID=2751238 RepID=UPI001BE62D0F|nr:glycosyltransferase [Exiguobacterium sp. s28]
MERPLVSIVIPVYNGADYLKETIESALAQTYERIEVLVINDGSTDGGATAEIARSFGTRIRYYEKSNGGVSTALNLGIEKMRGEWFSWLSHDDLYLPEKIEAQVRQLERLGPQAATTVLSCGTGFIDETGRSIYRPRKRVRGSFTSEEMFDHLLLDSCLSGCALLVPRRALEEVGGFPMTYRYIQDWICWIEIALAGYSFVVTTDKHVLSRVHAKQQTKRIAELAPLETARFFERLLMRLSIEAEPSRRHIRTSFQALYRSTDRGTQEDLFARFHGDAYLTKLEQFRWRVWSTLYHHLVTTYRGVVNFRYR